MALHAGDQSGLAEALGAPPQDIGLPPLGEEPLNEDVGPPAMNQKMDELLGMMQAILTLLEGPSAPGPYFGAPPPGGLPPAAPIAGPGF